MNAEVEQAKEPAHETARRTLRDRYRWEVAAIAEDVHNKVEMGVLRDGQEAMMYLSDQLAKHPRTREVNLASETLAFVHQLELPETDITTKSDDEPQTNKILRNMAYHSMFAEVLDQLRREFRLAIDA